MLTTKKMVLAILLTTHTSYFHAGITKTIFKGIIIPTTLLNLGIRYYQADFDYEKFTRNLRMEKDATCDALITNLKQNCDNQNPICKEITEYLKKAKSSAVQQAKDYTNNKIDEAKKAYSRK